MGSDGDGGQEGPGTGWWRGRRGEGGGGGGLGGVVPPSTGAGRLQPGREPTLFRVRPARGHLRGYHRGQLRLHHLLRPPVSGLARRGGPGQKKVAGRHGAGRVGTRGARDLAAGWAAGSVSWAAGSGREGRSRSGCKSRCGGEEGHRRGRERLPEGGEGNCKLGGTKWRIAENADRGGGGVERAMK